MQVSFPIHEVSALEFPLLLREIPDIPKQLFYRGALPPKELTLLSVVGSRKYTTYGKQVIDHLISGLEGYPVGIVSGLALGIDSLAHEAALQHGLYTLAVPGSGISDSVIYPASHKPLARRILESGGGLLSEYEPEFKATKWSFVQRNRIMAGIAHATLVIEASEKSGTLTTARMAVDYNRELLVVPGNIFSANSAGVHQFLKLGATPVTTAEDILYALHIKPEQKEGRASLGELSSEEKTIIELLREPMEKDALIRLSLLDISRANVLLMQMEMKGLIASEQNTYRAVI